MLSPCEIVETVYSSYNHLSGPMLGTNPRALLESVLVDDPRWGLDDVNVNPRSQTCMNASVDENAPAHAADEGDAAENI